MKTFEDALTDWALEFHKAQGRYATPDEIRAARERLRRPFRALQDSEASFQRRIRDDAEEAGKGL